jgi:hypothetical protein
MIDVVPGAAGGPKGLGISALDRVLFGEWLPRAPRVRHLIGVSIGAWRFAAACSADPVAALREFADVYVAQSYPPKPSRQFVSNSAREMMRTVFAHREREILSNPHYRLHVLAVRGRWPLTRDSSVHTPLGFGVAALANAVGRRHLARFVDRTVFHDAREKPHFAAFSGFDAFRTHFVALDAENLAPALMASIAIPLVLEGVPNVPNAPAGVYWDGGIADYHLFFPYHHTTGLVLYPHFIDRIVPGWLDKGLPWRRASGEWLDNVVLIAPSREYLAALPHGKLPSRKDFTTYAGDDPGRMKYWRRTIAESERLAEAFLEFARRPDPARVLPL